MWLNSDIRLLRWPLDKHIITSGWYYNSGKLHRALDLRGSIGTDVKASEDGEVVWVQYWDGRTRTGNQSYGNAIKIKHQDYKGHTVHTLYAHLSSIQVKVGEKVVEGQIIGRVGNTGNSFGQHLHFEVRYDNNRQQPLNWLDGSFEVANQGVKLGKYTSVVVKEADKNKRPDLHDVIVYQMSQGDVQAVINLATQLGVKYSIK